MRTSHFPHENSVNTNKSVVSEEGWWPIGSHRRRALNIGFLGSQLGIKLKLETDRYCRRHNVISEQSRTRDARAYVCVCVGWFARAAGDVAGPERTKERAERTLLESGAPLRRPIDFPSILLSALSRSYAA